MILLIALASSPARSDCRARREPGGVRWAGLPCAAPRWILAVEMPLEVRKAAEKPPVKMEVLRARRRSRMLFVSSLGGVMAGVSKGVTDADNWGGEANVIDLRNWWHIADVTRSVGTVMVIAPLVYMVGTGEMRWTEAFRYGVGVAMHADFCFKLTYHGLRWGSPIDLRPEHNRGMIYLPGAGGDNAIDAGHWSVVALHRATLYFGGQWLKANVARGHGFFWPMWGE